MMDAQTVSAWIATLGPYWGWVSVALILSVVGEGLKRRVFTRHLALRSPLVRLWRQTMTLHPIIAGALIGLVHDMPLPEGVTGLAQSVLYYAGAGGFSVIAYDVIKTVAKYRGFELKGD